MRLPKLAINNYIFTLVVFILVTIAGLLSFINMPRTENPSIYIPGTTIFVINPGVNPADLEQLIALPLEEGINELDDIKKVSTTCWNGVVAISVEFNYGTNAKEKYDDVVSKINDIKSDLPPDIFDILTIRWSSTDVVIMQLALTSEDASYAELDKLSDDLKRKLERSFGIKKVDVHALPKQEIRISIDMEKMAQMNIPLNMVINSVNSYNANIPGGSIKLSDKYFTLKTSGSYSNIEDIKNTVVSSYMGKIVHLKEIAEVKYDYEDQQYFARFKGKRAVFLSLEQKADINIFKINKKLIPIIEDYRMELGDNISLDVVFDQSKNVQHRISNFMSNLTQGVILVGLVILFILGIKSSIIVIIAIPLSIIIGLGVVDYTGYGLQQISIAGLVIALGLLVDNSIVMIENIARYIKMGYKPKDAAIAGASEIGWPVISATATTVLAFIPIIMMPDTPGEFIRSLPVTITATLTVSLFIALTITPLVASLLLKPNGIKKIEDNNENRKKINFLDRFVEGPYRKALSFSLRNKFLVLGIATTILIISVYFFVAHLGKSFFPKAETPQFMVRVNLPEGTNIDKTMETTMWVESVLDTFSDIKHYASNVGKGNPRIYYNLSQKQNATNFSEIYVELYEYDIEKFDELVVKLRSIFKEYPGADIILKEFEQGTPIDAPVAIYVLGENIDVLQRISRDVEGFIKETKGTINVENLLDRTQTDLYFNINKDKASLFGVPVYEIDKTIRIALSGATISKYRDKSGKEYNIVVRLPFDKRIKLSDFDKIYLSSLTGRQIPIKQLATIEFRKAPSLITRYNMERNAKVLADLEKGVNLDDVMTPILEKLNKYPFPPGYKYYIAGEMESRNESFGGMQKASIIALIAILAVLILQFNSFIQPLIIFSAIPLALIGSIWALFITKNTFSFTAAIGLISLIGIVVNNSIILVDYINILRKKGVELYEAVQNAGETRFTPIILTTFTTVGGLLPLTLKGGTMWAPMGWTIIGGLLVSTFLTLLIVPVLYSGLERFMEKIGISKKK